MLIVPSTVVHFYSQEYDPAPSSSSSSKLSTSSSKSKEKKKKKGKKGSSDENNDVNLVRNNSQLSHPGYDPFSGNFRFETSDEPLIEQY